MERHGSCGRQAAIIAILTTAVSFSAHARELTLEQRVQAQRAIEEVYWRERLWPEANRGPKPPLSAVVPDALLRARVEDYLEKSAALESLWQKPVDAEQLQEEIDRIAASTRAPSTLRALFAALDDDPRLVAETLARRSLVERLIRERWAHDAGSEPFDSWWSKQRSTVPAAAPDAPGVYSLPAIEGFACELDAWQMVSDGEQTPSPRVDHTAIWTGAELIVWGGTPTSVEGGGCAGGEPIEEPFGTGARYDPALDAWTPMTIVGAPTPRSLHTAVWTGSEMIVWGGVGDLCNSLGGLTGARYDPAQDTWVPMSTVRAPGFWGRADHTAVWTGSEMIVWGGGSFEETWFYFYSDGGRYDPISDSWIPMDSTPALGPRRSHTAVWTGAEMVVWGGLLFGSQTLSTGARYRPATDTWRPMTSTGGPAARHRHTALWSGSEMIVWGGWGNGNGSALASGARYDPHSDAWTSTATVDAPSGRSSHVAEWTGAEMIVWGGRGPSSLYFDDGARYDPGTDEWRALSNVDAPGGRSNHTAVWTGNEMIVWGGGRVSFYEAWDDGGLYCAVAEPDVDGDGVANGVDNCATASNTAQNNADGDAFGDACDPDDDNDAFLDADDCQPLDPGVWAAPSPAQHLAWDGHSLGWSPPAEPGCVDPRYDLLRANGPVGFDEPICLVQDSGSTTVGDPEPPAPGGAFFYLVRVRNPCGETLGANSDGDPRIGGACSSPNPI